MSIPTNPSLNEEWTNDATGVTYKWDGERWYVVSNAKSDLDSLNEDLTKRIDDGEAVQEEIQETISEALSKQSGILSEQEIQHDQINALETQIQLLAGVKAVGRWKYNRRIDGSSVRPPNIRTFYGTDVRDVSTPLTSWENTNLLMINKTDLEDNVFTFSEFETGDKVEVIAVDGSSAVYGTVTNDPNIDSYGNFVIDVERWRGGPVEDAEYLISAYRPGSSSPEVDLDILDQRYLTKTGGVMSGPLNFKKGDKDNNQFKISPNGGEDYATNIYSFYGQMRFRTSHTNNEGDHVGSHIVLSSNGGSPETKIYHVVESGETGAVPKSYVDGKAGVPVGSIMIWMNSAAPDGWFKLQGSNFDITKYPQLHAYLQNTSGYTSGVLPSWSGHYPGEYGDHLRNDLGSKQGAQTAKPTAGTPRSSNDIPNGTTRGFSAAGSTNAYSAGASKVSISENWDSTTRPKTVVVHYIIKHD